MTEQPTRPQPVHPALMPPVDPWIGTAPVAPPGYGAEPEPVIVVVERPRRRRWPWIVGGLAALALLCCAGAAAIWAPIGREYPATLQLGDSAAGFDRVRDPEIDRATAELEVQMFREHDVDDGLAAMLVDPAAPDRRIILLAATKLILDPGGLLDEAARGVADRPVRDITDYGHLGPALVCLDTRDDESQPVVVCAWGDHGSLGVGIFYGDWTMDDAAVALRDLRSAVVSRR